MKKLNYISKFKKFIQQTKYNKIFIISGVNSFNKSGAKKIFKTFKRKNIKIYFKKKEFPEIIELKKIYLSLNSFKPDLIVALGGGAVLDYGKIASIIDSHTNIKKIILKNQIPKKKNYTLVAVPTTSGSGAEVTPNAVMYINKIKYAVDEKKVRPNKYFLIPSLTIPAPKKIKASSGFDAIAQSIESLISVRSTQESLNFAKRSLEYSLKSYVDFVNVPNDRNAERMSIAANLSGKAIGISKTTAPHAISYPFTAHFGIPHGHAVSLTLDKILLYNFNYAKYSRTKFNLIDRYNLIFKLTKTKNILDLFLYIKKLKLMSGLEDNFNNLGINILREKQKLLSGINESRLLNNPVNIKVGDIISIIS